MAAKVVHSRNLRDSFYIAVFLAGLYWFAASFFLAKKSLSHISSCHEPEALLVDVLGLSAEQVKALQDHHVLSQSSQTHRKGCWMSRRVDSVVLLLVDALRFDFCLYNLPDSVGTRLSQKDNATRLFRFVADPPTVTMQRLKALTTGGLPTFADISANFGGASLEDDSWMHQLLRHTKLDYTSRALRQPTSAAFVGDDTWLDLFPNLFTESYPYPSFNTRDLNTVDNGCLTHLPNLTRQVLGNELEVVVVHFLGVDHVGHTYGPHNQHMDAKLKQIDAALTTVLDGMDHNHQHCQAAWIFGDHGMTEEGNHGGGTEEEVSAALFVHVSPGCGDMTQAISLEHDSSLLWGASKTFASIHQIDMVPTLSMMLGLPVPFANLGSLVPSLVPGFGHLETVTALALNAAQVWRYLTTYSGTANTLPNLHHVKSHLDLAVSVYRQVIDRIEQDGEADADLCNQASGLMKLFLAEALVLGQRVWTRFDDKGMIGGISVMLIALIAYARPFIQGIINRRLVRNETLWECSLSLVSMVFFCGVLSFSNSYIEEEQHAIMYFLSCISIAMALRMQSDPTSATVWRGVLLLPVASRINELFVSGHGLDPSLQVHLAHSVFVFLLSTLILVSFRWYLYQTKITKSLAQVVLDCTALVFLLASWYEKHLPDQRHDGFVMCRVALILLAAGLVVLLCEGVQMTGNTENSANSDKYELNIMVTILSKVLVAIVAVTGPAGASSLLLYTFQIVAIYILSLLTGSLRIDSVVLATLWKLVTRHIFFATNHACAFNRLHYSSAFVATSEFYFVTGGISLFLNTFGWELVGVGFAWFLSKQQGRAEVWRIYTFFQLMEAVTSCISVSVLRRNLMVWNIFAPNFLFASSFTALTGLWQLSCTFLSVL